VIKGAIRKPPEWKDFFLPYAENLWQFRLFQLIPFSIDVASYTVAFKKIEGMCLYLKIRSKFHAVFEKDRTCTTIVTAVEWNLRLIPGHATARSDTNCDVPRPLVMDRSIQQIFFSYWHLLSPLGTSRWSFSIRRLSDWTTHSKSSSRPPTNRTARL
jgi:hypothetical protein